MTSEKQLIINSDSLAFLHQKTPIPYRVGAKNKLFVKKIFPKLVRAASSALLTIALTGIFWRRIPLLELNTALQTAT
jgi:hypothetical protein